MDDDCRGRFLPSRTYARWKWTVRFGLLIVTATVFLAGSVTLYFTPNRYRSSTVFEVVNGPPSQETAALLKSETMLGMVSDQLNLPDRMDLDKFNCIEAISKNTEVKPVKDTRLIRLNVTWTLKTDARDIAQAIPEALVKYLAENNRNQSNAMQAEVQRMIHEAADRAKERSVEWARLRQTHGDPPTDAGAAATVERARRLTEAADIEVERLQSRRRTIEFETLDRLPRLVVHTAPVISSSAVSPKTGEELNRLALTSLAAGLCAALTLPYLLELAFPPPRKRRTTPVPAEDP